ncbi:hypothetical protein DMUE_0338 [Dictyocoela muelleri]|nr:hypothetical protein DMUE_0338 [Dictyocoela muelleri]
MFYKIFFKRRCIFSNTRINQPNFVKLSIIVKTYLKPKLCSSWSDKSIVSNINRSRRKLGIIGVTLFNIPGGVSLKQFKQVLMISETSSSVIPAYNDSNREYVNFIPAWSFEWKFFIMLFL